MNVKKWHIFDFPSNLYVLLTPKYRRIFFDIMYSIFGSQKKYAEFLEIDRNCVQGYHYARDWHNHKKCLKYLPLWVLRKSSPFLSRSMKERIEKNILSIRGKGGNQIDTPKLPFRESPSLYRLVAHLIGDGNDSHTPYYSNTCKQLRERFKEDLKTFGKIKNYETKSVQNPRVICVNFTKTVTHILRHILDIEFTHPFRIPASIFNAPENCKKAFLQALFDDEGYVSTSIGIAMKEKRLIEEIKTLCQSIDIETTNIAYSKNPRSSGTYSISIRITSILKFGEKIRFGHPEKNKKLEIRKKIIERNKSQRTRPLEWTRNEILRLLKRKPMSTLRLSESLLLTITGLYHHLRYLEKRRFIERTGYKNAAIWKLRSGPHNLPVGHITLVINDSQ